MLFAPFAILFEINFALYEFLIFGTPIIDSFAFGAREFY